MVALGEGKLDELELLTGGLLAPADGYCLPSNVPANWPVPFLLEVPSAVGREALTRGALVLTDPDGTPLAHLAVAEAQPGGTRESVYLAGRVARLRNAEHPPARNLRITRPLTATSRNRTATLAAVFSTTPRPWQVAAAMTAANHAAAHLWLIGVCGPQHHGRYTVSGLLHELEAAAACIDGARAGLLVLPEDPAGDSPRALILQDHVLGSLGADQVVDYSAGNDAVAHDRGQTVDTQLAGTVVFLTGLSGSGKSTVARALAERLQQEESVPVTLLDGDDVRRILSPGLGFSREERDGNVRRIGWVAALVAATGGIAICAPIAPFDGARRQVRAMAEDAGRFVLVHISTPLAVCEARDRKGLYAKARRGEVKEFTGIDSPYEFPVDADLHLNTDEMSVSEAVARIHRHLGMSHVPGQQEELGG